MKKSWLRLWREEEGQDLVEYALLLVLISLIALASKAARVIGLVLILIGFALTVHWYISWLDRYFSLSPLSYYLPQIFGLYLMAVLTSPVIPLVTVIEWMWHGWPQEPTWGFWCWLFGYALLLAGRRPPQGPEDIVGPEHE